MGAKIKHRQTRLPRNHQLKENILAGKGGPHKDRRDKRGKRDNLWQDDSFDEIDEDRGGSSFFKP